MTSEVVRSRERETILKESFDVVHQLSLAVQSGDQSSCVSESEDVIISTTPVSGTQANVSIASSTTPNSRKRSSDIQESMQSKRCKFFLNPTDESIESKKIGILHAANLSLDV